MQELVRSTKFLKSFKNLKIMYEKFNSPDTLGIISSYPAYDGEVARGNAISRYTYLLTKNLPKGQKVIVFSEIRKARKPFLIAENILVVPTYRLNSPSFLLDILKKTLNFDAIRSILIEYEFSIFGGKIIIPQILMLLLALKFIGKSTKIMFHQVVTNIDTLSGHLAIKKEGIKAKILNSLLRFFYKMCGILTDKVLVHDAMLAGRISNFVDVNKVRIIPHGINMEKKISKTFAKESKKYFGVREGFSVVGLFGYCSWYKGTDWLIENFARFAKENKKLNVRLLVAGGESPTLKGTIAYQKYHKKLKKVIKEANGNIIYTGYVPDRDVRKVFAATDLFVFPYRTKMSASGAFSLCLGYKKPYLISKAFSENISKTESKGRMFDLSYQSFSKILNKEIKSNESFLKRVQCVSWKDASIMYLTECLPENETLPRLSYAQAF